MRTVRANPDEASGSSQHATDGGLAELIEFERRAEAELAAARREAEERVESARREAGRLLEEPDGELEAAVASLRSELEREEETLRAGIEQRAGAEVARFEGVEESAVERLARLVAARLAGREAPP